MTPRPSRTDSATTVAAVVGAVRRLVRQERDDAWAVRLLRRIVFGLAAAYTIFILASANMASFIVVSALLVLAGLLWLLRRRGQLLLGLASTIVTAAVAGFFAATVEIATRSSSGMLGGQAVFGYWALAAMALLGAWMVKEHPGRRGVTVVLADAVLLVVSGVGTVLPAVAVPLGFVGVVLVLTFRGGGAAALRRRGAKLKSRFPRRAVSAADTRR
ncbi:hypothetical protein [Streptomyces sp. NPDC057939]|uniref:hypothetical protein n=1 Tax=Streptomyces sp. NPDC057939 TaxID=3346284 RepID=UPI0036E30A64